ncbi:MAG: FKBP-type peptidyl-prolyl cis-trans isomerase [Thermoleophilaceae bacterium]|nr:FKBP-type peptidyl-prolyl cis-trans isomerase [Thermoleophilaceae bacterium]
MKLKLGIILSAVLIAVAFAGCGDSKTTNSSDATEAATAETGATPAESTGKPGKTPKVTGKLGEAPKVAAPEGEPPSDLVIKDVKKGTGATAKSGDTVSVQYYGLNWSNGEKFDASWDRGQPFSFELGAGNVIAGWDEGVAGMKEGGRRVLVIPPDKGYGEAGSPPSIPPNETLVFVVDLEKVK